MQNQYSLIRKVVAQAHAHRRNNVEVLNFSPGPSLLNLDLARVQYGGMFSSFEVDEVNSTLRVLRLLISGGFVFALETSFILIFPFLSRHTLSNSNVVDSDALTCDEPSTITGSGNLSLMLSLLLIPIVYLISDKRKPSMRARFTVGAILLLLATVCNFLIDTIAHSLTPDVQCMFTFEDISFGQTLLTDSQLSIFVFVFAFQNILFALSHVLIHTSALEFILVETPPSMTGVVVSVFYCIQGVYALAEIAIVLFWYLLYEYWFPSITVPSCGLLYYLMNVVLGSLGLTWYVWNVCTYKWHVTREDEEEGEGRGRGGRGRRKSGRGRRRRRGEGMAQYQHNDGTRN